jgi:hypothetical protein
VVKRALSKDREKLINTSMFNVAVKTLIDFPSSQTVVKLSNEFQPQHKRFTSIFLTNLFLEPRQSRAVLNYLENFLLDQEICQNLRAWLNDSVT